VITANCQQLMNMVNNLYVGNIAHEVTEDMIARIYSRYGELESVKVMQPRTEEERKRKRNCAFIKFHKYESAYIAKEELAERFLYGQQMRICWAKGISN
jgi:U2-associated protein SR140